MAPRTVLIGSVAVLLLGGGAMAQTTVDLELSLVVDSSGSIGASDFALQQGGYESAFRDPAIQTGIEMLPNGLSANLIFFSSSAVEAIPFTFISNTSEAEAFADAIAGLTRPFSGLTSIAAGLDLATQTLNANLFDGPSVIDVSSDGVPTTGGDTATARDNALAANIQNINALAVGFSDVSFLEDNVIGPDGFIVTAESFDEFGGAIARKLAIEITGMDPISPE